MSVGEAVPESIKPGITIAFHERAGMDILLDGKVWKVVKYDEIYGIVFEIEEEREDE
jgi:co-chaperonin GroES (HSP10)